MAGPLPITYMTWSTSSGLNGKLRPRPGTKWVQASSSSPTFFLLICLSEEYCIESIAPPKSLHVEYGCFGAADCPKTATRPANSVEIPASRRDRVEVRRAFLFIDSPLLSSSKSELSPEGSSAEYVFHKWTRVYFFFRDRRLTVCSILSR